jgi:hypothetical protein
MSVTSEKKRRRMIQSQQNWRGKVMDLMAWLADSGRRKSMLVTN